MLRAVSPGTRSPAWGLALGWPIGIVLGVLAFSLTAALGVRDAFAAYPLIVGIPAALVFFRRNARLEPGHATPLFPSQPQVWLLTGLCLLFFAYVGVYYAQTPLPDSLPTVATGFSYHSDLVFYIALIAEALHHWPIADAGVTGEPFSYHYFAELHMAGISQVTGISPAVILFRLYLLPLIAVLTLQMALAGRIITGKAWAGPLAVALFFLVRAIDVSAYEPAPFTGGDLFVTALNPSTMLGLTILVPAVTLLSCMLDRRIAERAPPNLTARRPELFVLLVILLVGAGGAKSMILPLLIAGLGIFVLWQRIRDGLWNRLAITTIAVCAVVFAVYVAILYNSGAPELRLGAGATLKNMTAWMRLHDELWGSLLGEVGFWVIAVLVGVTLYFLAPLLGLAWLRERGSKLGAGAMIGISIFLAGLPAFFFLAHDFQAQAYFPYYGIVAVLPLAAGGLIRFFGAPERRDELRWGRVAAFSAIWVAVILALAYLANRRAHDASYFSADARLYAPVAVLIALLVVGALLSRGRRRALLSGFAVIAVLLTASLDVPLDTIPDTYRSLRGEKPLYFTRAGGLRPGQMQGMEWIRDHLPEDAVLAVSNDRIPGTRSYAPADRDYPAFTERRTFLEGWFYSAEAYGEEHQALVYTGETKLFPRRRKLEREVFHFADPRALQVMVERFGVTHLVIDRRDGKVNPRVYRLGRLIYSNGAVDVIAVAPA